MAAFGWSAALDEAAAKIAEYKRLHGADAIGAVVGAQATNEEVFALKRLMASIGSRSNRRAQLVARRRARATTSF